MTTTTSHATAHGGHPPGVLDHEACYRAVASRDARFDGRFITAVRSTGIYCRPSCPAMTPKRRNVEFLRTAAAAQQAGYRACKRCLPDAVPGSPEWDLRGDLAARAVRLIEDGVVDRHGVDGLAARLHVGARHLRRVLVDEVGAGPLPLARTRRAHTARILIETTDLPFGDVAHAAGFQSLRQFNDTIRAIHATTPTALRAARRSRRDAVADGEAGVVPHVCLRLAVRPPFDGVEVLRWLAARAVAHVETVREDDRGPRWWMRAVALPGGPAILRATPHEDHVQLDAWLHDWADLTAAVTRTRRLFDLDADPAAIAAVIRPDARLRPVAAAHPGLRSPGTLDPAETAIRAVLGQQVSVAGAAVAAARITERAGTDVPPPLVDAVRQALLLEEEDDGAVPTRLFPSGDALAALDPATLPMPRARATTLVALAGATADGSLPLHVGADRAAVRAALLARRGIGPWTADYVVLRGLADPDVLLTTDLVVRRGAAALGLPDEPRALDAIGAGWAPWRSYVSHLLWRAAP